MPAATILTFPVPAQHRRWTWPDWPPGLYEDSDGHHHYDRGDLDRETFDECVRAVGKFNGPALLDDLVSEGTLDLARPDMAGAVAAIWAADEYAESALSRWRWVELFVANGFHDRPAEPVRLYRGCVPMFIHFDASGHLVAVVAVDTFGCPLDPYGEIVESWHTTAGMAWTRDLRAARRFARKHCGGQGFTATVQPDHLLAAIGSEYVVDPAGLDDVAPLDLGIADTAAAGGGARCGTRPRPTEYARPAPEPNDLVCAWSSAAP
ncbi:hypothetical protein MSIMFI_04927 [Mycobacterium simulans]|uniref:hypothetical protein n=1 Tax=Mycobacterium simulans TaxID=627089 RepID=UPI00174A347C|nr:hypothetical protein [Mycobacterium simulans]SON63397.1 hypothetical protein MSIMFI_04927 [Mycobacterium simulans]